MLEMDDRWEKAWRSLSTSDRSLVVAMVADRCQIYGIGVVTRARRALACFFFCGFLRLRFFAALVGRTRIQNTCPPFDPLRCFSTTTPSQNQANRKSITQIYSIIWPMQQ